MGGGDGRVVPAAGGLRKPRRREGQGARDPGGGRAARAAGAGIDRSRLPGEHQGTSELPDDGDGHRARGLRGGRRRGAHARREGEGARRREPADRPL
jgi:hypothetical protein